MIENGGAPCTRNVIFERRFCTRHTGPVAVEFTVFLRARLQPPLSTGAEHTLSPQKRYPSSRCQYLHANARKERDWNRNGYPFISSPALFLSSFFYLLFFPRSLQTNDPTNNHSDLRSTMKSELHVSQRSSVNRSKIRFGK